MKLFFNILENTLHSENCPKYTHHYVKEFINIDEKNDYEFIFSVVSNLIKDSPDLVIEICPYCLGQQYDFLSEKFNLF